MITNTTITMIKKNSAANTPPAITASSDLFVAERKDLDCAATTYYN